MFDEELARRLAVKHALNNAILHDGKAIESAVISKVFAEQPDWKKFAKDLLPIVKKEVEKVNQLCVEEQRTRLAEVEPKLLVREKKIREFVLPPLPNAEKYEKIVMRLAPFPSGPLHIGNARMAILNDEYVKKYKGELILVYDDTIGSGEKVPLPEAYQFIAADLKWLGVDYTKVVYKSDRLEYFYDFAEKLIKINKAYVCHCSTKELREKRAKGVECLHRKYSKSENLHKWNRMLDGEWSEEEAVLRIKTSLDHPNPAFRDRVIFRIVSRPHPRVGDKYAVWPLLEFSWAVDDHLLGITHILRGKDLVIEDEMEKYIWSLFDIQGPEIVHHGMLRIKDIKLSKSKSQLEIKSGKLEGWSDPRTWSLQSLQKRGIQPDALRNFILSFGMSLADIEVPAENLYAQNRKAVDYDAMRFFFVPVPIKIKIVNLPKIEFAQIPIHPDRPEKGVRKLAVKDEVYVAKNDFQTYKNCEIRLKNFCNVVLMEEAKFTSQPNKPIPKIQWLCEGITVKVVMPDGETVEGLGEKSLMFAKVGDIVQFERIGFARIDKTADGEIVAYFSHK